MAHGPRPAARCPWPTGDPSLPPTADADNPSSAPAGAEMCEIISNGQSSRFSPFTRSCVPLSSAPCSTLAVIPQKLHVAIPGCTHTANVPHCSSCRCSAFVVPIVPHLLHVPVNHPTPLLRVPLQAAQYVLRTAQHGAVELLNCSTCSTRLLRSPPKSCTANAAFTHPCTSPVYAAPAPTPLNPPTHFLRACQGPPLQEWATEGTGSLRQRPA
jgi:hypothetical protein